MTQYVYKGFKICYSIQPSSENLNLYKADGYAIRPTQKETSTAPQKFHTEHPTKEGAKNEIKKLLEDYIDFEWQEFHEMQKEIREN
nr:hypothetical protein [Legionella jordanis]